jgi:hypothetical protein
MPAHEIVRTFHSTCMVEDYDETVDALARLAGLRVLEYTENELIGRRGGMVWIGDNSIEVAQPIVADHATQKFIDRFGQGMHSYAFQVRDLTGTLEHLATGGVAVGVMPLDWFCFTDPRTTGGLLFEWSLHTVPEDPREGAEEPPYVVEPLLDVRTHSFVGAVHPDPVGWAEAFGPLFGLTEISRDLDAPAGHPVVTLNAADDCVIALYALPGDASQALWGASHERARFHVLGLGVPDLGAARVALEGAGVRVLWHDDRFVAIDPADAGGLTVVLVEGGLPGDPKSGRFGSTI